MKDDIKDLLELAKSPEPSVPVKEFPTDIDQFITDTGIVEDPTGCVDVKHVHWAYVKWCEFRNLKPLYINHFSRWMHKRFKGRQSFRRRTYFVNKEPFILDTNEYWRMMAYYRKEKQRSEKATSKRKASRAKKAVQQQG